MDENQIEPSLNSNENDSFLGKNKEYKTGGAKSLFHGHKYHFDFLMIYLCRAYNIFQQTGQMFRIAVEMEAADKFDDIIVQFNKDGKTSSRFLQLKHKDKSDAVIDYDDLLEKRKSDYDLIKYFISYFNIKRNPDFHSSNKEGIQDVILLTNIGFSNEIQYMFENEYDEFMKTDLLRFKKVFDGRGEVMSNLQHYAKVIKSADYLVNCVLNNETINGNKLMCPKRIMDEVINFKTKQLKPSFAKIQNDKLLSDDAKIIKEHFKKKFIECNEALVIEKDPVLDENFAEEFVNMVLNNEDDSVDFISASEETKRNLKNIIGHVLVQSCEDGEVIVSDLFLNNGGLPASITAFRAKVIEKLPGKNLQILENLVFYLDSDIECCEDIYLRESVFWYQIQNKKLNISGNLSDGDKPRHNIEAKQIVEEFLTKLKFAVKQPEEEELTKIMYEEMYAIFKETDVSLECKYMCDELHKWFIDKKGVFFDCDDMKRLLEDINDNKSSIVIKALADNFEKSFIKTPVRFMSTNEQVINFLKNDKCKVLNVNNRYGTLLSTLNIFQTLKKDDEYADKFVCLSTSQISNNKNHLVSALKVSTLSLLVIMFEEPFNENEINELLKNLTASGKQVILVTKNFYTSLSSHFKDHYENYEDEIKFVHFDLQSRDILMNKTIEFQGREIKFEKIGSDFIEQEINSEDLTRLIQNEQLTIGCRSQEIQNEIYVERELTRDGNIQKITSLNDIFEPTVLIDSEPGMGKSMLLTKLAQETRFDENVKWVVRVNLNLCTKLLQMDYVDTEKILEFLLSVERPGSGLAKRFFEYCTKAKNRMVLLVDGVDEIIPDYTVTVVDILTQLQRAQNVQMWVTTRSSFRNELETALDVISYQICPFNEKNQRVFFNKTWEKLVSDNNGCDTSYVNLFTEKILRFYSRNFHDENYSFTSIPLYAKLLGSALADDFQNFYKSKGTNVYVPTVFDTLTLYEKIVKDKFIVYEKEKKNQYDGTAVASKHDSQILFNLFQKSHECFSFSTLFSQRKSTNLLSESEKKGHGVYMENIKDGTEKSSLIIYHSNYEKFGFEHYTFAEYFSACFLHKKLEENSLDEHLSSFFKEYMLMPEFKTIRMFLDKLLFRNTENTEYELHRAVLNGNDLSVDILVKKNSEIVNAVDIFGRTPLQLSVFYFNSSICNKLLKSKEVDFTIDEKIFDLNAVQLSYLLNKWEFIDVFLQYHHNMIAIKDFVDKNTLLIEAAKKKCMNLLEFLLDNGANMNVRDRSGNTLLHIAVEAFNTKLIKVLIDKGIDINIPNTSNQTPLHVALIDKYFNMADFLIENGAGFDDKSDQLQNTILHQMAFIGSVPSIEYLITKKADVNTKNMYDETPLHFAAQNGCIEAAKCLIKNGADVNAVDKHSKSPLLTAVRFNQLKFVQFLIDNNADVNYLKNETCNETPLHRAVKNNDFEMVKLLIENKALINIHDKDNKTPLDFARSINSTKIIDFISANSTEEETYTNEDKEVNYVPESQRLKIMKGFLTPTKSTVDISIQHLWLFEASAQGHVTLIEYLIECKVPLDIYNENGNSPLHLSACNGKANTTDCLIRNGLSVETPEKKLGDTALHFAVFNNCLDVVKVLVDHKVNINARNNLQETALHFSSLNGYLDMTEYLIDNGAELDAPDKTGRPPIHYAAQNGHTEVIKLLLERKTSPNLTDYEGHTALHCAAKNGHIQSIEMLLKYKANINVCNQWQKTPLHFAVGKGQLDAVRFLIANGAFIDSLDHEDQTPLFYSVSNNYPEITEFLIENKASTDIRNSTEFGQAPIHIAVQHGSIDMVKVFLKFNVDINLRNKIDQTPLLIAAARGRVEMIDFLIDNGATVDVADDKGCTPLHVAVVSKYEEVIKLLLERNAPTEACESTLGLTPFDIAKSSGYENIVQLFLEHKAKVV